MSVVTRGSRVRESDRVKKSAEGFASRLRRRCGRAPAHGGFRFPPPENDNSKQAPRIAIRDA
jgi:hypothetical protein